MVHLELYYLFKVYHSSDAAVRDPNNGERHDHSCNHQAPATGIGGALGILPDDSRKSDEIIARRVNEADASDDSFAHLVTSGRLTKCRISQRSSVHNLILSERSFSLSRFGSGAQAMKWERVAAVTDPITATPP